MASLAKVLKQLDKEWKDVEAAEVADRVIYTDGNYIVTMKPARVELSKATDRLQIAWPMEFAEGKYEGKNVTKYDGLDNEVSISWAKATMKSLGIDIPKSSVKLPVVLGDFFEDDYDDKLVAITIKTDGEFTNIYINGYFKSEDDSDDKKPDFDKSTKEYDGPSKKKIKKMTKKEVKKLIKTHDIEVDSDDYDDLEELIDAVIEEIEED